MIPQASNHTFGFVTMFIISITSGVMLLALGLVGWIGMMLIHH